MLKFPNSQTAFARLGLLAVLYVSQGLPHGFFIRAAPAIFRERGLSLEHIGFAGLLFLPWTIKFMLAPIIDRHFFSSVGRRRSWIIPLQFINILIMVSLMFLNPDSPLWGLFLGIFIMNLASSTQDIATDGYAVDLLKPQERGWGNSLQVGGYFAGFVLGSGLILVLYQFLLWQGTFLFMALLLFLFVVPTLLRKELPPKDLKVERVSLGRFFKKKYIWRMLGILILFRVGTGFVQNLVSPMMVDMGFELSEIGTILGVFGSLGALAGALVGGWMVSHFGRHRSLLFAGLLRLIPAIAFALLVPSWFDGNHLDLLTWMVVGDQFFYGMSNVIIFSLMMDWSDSEQGATDYTMQDSLGVLGTIIINAFIDVMLASIFGYQVAALISVVLMVLSLMIVILLFDKTLHQYTRDRRRAAGEQI